jgi:hypothetical protein
MTLFCILFFVMDISANIPPQREVAEFGGQHKLYNAIETACAERRGGKATFYHFSGASTINLITTLFHNGYEIDLYTQGPSLVRMLGSSHQETRIKEHEFDFMRRFGKEAEPGRGSVRLWRSNCPLTVRAMVLDDDWIILGWYLYRKNLNVGDNNEYSSDTVHLSGHDVFGVSLKKGHAEFRSALEFLERYRHGIAAEQIWSSDGQPGRMG